MEATSDIMGYRPVSRLAVAACLAGVLSSLALTTPMLWALPLVGIALAVVGLADVTRAGAEKAGRGLALAGLALSVGFGCQAVASAVVTDWITRSRVESVVHAWLDALHEDRLAEAQSMLDPGLLPRDQPGPGAPMPLDHDHQHDHDHADEKSITSLPAVAAAIGCGKSASREVRCIGRDEETGERWLASVRLDPCGDRGPLTLRLELFAAEATEGKKRVERWRILRIERG
ncbi:MAG: hypothetical protein ACKOTB_16120 [Planctomycetia bacterium]